MDNEPALSPLRTVIQAVLMGQRLSVLTNPNPEHLKYDSRCTFFYPLLKVTLKNSQPQNWNVNSFFSNTVKPPAQPHCVFESGCCLSSQKEKRSTQNIFFTRAPQIILHPAAGTCPLPANETAALLLKRDDTWWQTLNKRGRENMRVPLLLRLYRQKWECLEEVRVI